MKKFFIKLLNFTMFSSFILALLLVFLFPFLEMEVTEYGYVYESDIKFWDTLENIVNFIIGLLNIDFKATQLQICISFVIFFVLCGFISKWLLKKIDY